MKQFLKKGKAEGSVLFTVVSVMLVMVVFLMSTMVLTSSASRRSFYSYYENQAQYAAQAALDAVTNSAYTDAEFYDWVQKSTATATPGSLPTVTVQFNGSEIQFTKDVGSVVECTIEKVDKGTLIWDDLTQAVHEQPAYKITAKASVGNGRNRSDYEVCNYIYENYRCPADKLPSVDNESRNKVHNWQRTSSTDPDNTGSLASAVWTIGMTQTGNNMTYFGPQNSGMSSIPAGRLKYADSGQTMSKTNDNYAVGNAKFIGNYSVGDGYGLIATFEKFGESAQFYGDLIMNGSGHSATKGIHFNAKLSDDEVVNARAAYGGSIPYTATPYVYVDGVLRTQNGGIYLGYDEEVTTEGHITGRDDEFSHVNLYAGAVRVTDSGAEFSVAGDAYLYDPSEDSVIIGVSGFSTLQRFTRNNVEKANTQWGDYAVGGNLICNNKTLTLNNNTNQKDMTIQGDLIFTNPAGKLIISNPITVNGKVLCAGELDGLGNINCGTIVTKEYAKVNGDEKTTENYAEGEDIYISTDDSGNKTFNYADYLYHNYADGAYYDRIRYDETTSQDEAYNAFKATGSVLMPYSLRQDEIFDEYYRWDLQSSTEAAAEALIETDPLIAESYACGHSWYIKSFAGFDTYVIDSQKFEEKELFLYDQNPPEGLEILYDSGNVWEQGEDGNYHWRIIKYKVKVLVEETGHWQAGAVTYVPYTKAESSNNFIKHFEPIRSNENKASLIEPKYYINSLTKFTQGVTGMTEYENKKQGTHKDVTVVFHNANAEEATATLTNALVITESCYVDVSGTADDVAKIPIFIDPYKNGYNDSTPLRVVIRGYGDNQLIVVNNTAVYSGSDYNAHTSLYDLDTIAGRRSVYIFFENGAGGGAQPFRILMSGSYGQYTGKYLNIISNPIYPFVDGKANGAWDSLDAADKFAYELVPNAVIFGESGASYTFNNASVFNAEVIMPDSSLNFPNAELTKIKIDYREEYYSEKYSTDATSQGSNGLSCFGFGTIMADGVTNGSNTACVAYIGDSHRGGSDEIKDGGLDEISKNSAKLGADDVDYFNNDHLGAS